MSYRAHPPVRWPIRHRELRTKWTIEINRMCLTPTALPQSQPGVMPQESGLHLVSALEGATQGILSRLDCDYQMKRAFNAQELIFRTSF